MLTCTVHEDELLLQIRVHGAASVSGSGQSSREAATEPAHRGRRTDARAQPAADTHLQHLQHIYRALQ